MTMKCGNVGRDDDEICNYECETISQLRTHWTEAHIENLRPIDEMLSAKDKHISSLEILAEECTVGHKDAPWTDVPYADTPQIIAEIAAMKWLVNKKRREVRI